MATKRLYIVGAGGFGREVAGWASEAFAATGECEVAGFLDDNPKALEGYPCDWPIVGRAASFQFGPDDRVVVAVCEPRIKKMLVDRVAGRAEFATIIHPTVIIGRHCHVGRGSILCPRGVLTTNVVLGEHVHMNLGATVGHDARVGAYSTMHSHVDVMGWAVLEEGVLLGSHAAVLPKARVGAMARVGTGSVVLRNVPPGETVFGSPARRI